MSQLFSEFDMSPYLSDAMTDSWQQLMQRRLAWNEVYRDPRLSDWENRGSMRAFWKHWNMPHSKVYLQFLPEDFNEADFYGCCKALQSTEQNFIIKPYHLAGLQGIYSYQQKGFTALTETPLTSNDSPPGMRLGIKPLVKRMSQIIIQEAQAEAAWSLRKSQKGLLLEAYPEADSHLSLLTVWGHVIGAAIRGSNDYLDRHGYYHGKKYSSWAWLAPNWSELVRLCERLAHNTDLLEVSFYLNQDGQLWVDEMRTLLSPHDTRFAPFFNESAEALKAGYRQPIRRIQRSFCLYHSLKEDKTSEKH